MSYLGVAKKAEITVSDSAYGSAFAALIKTIFGEGRCIFNPSEFSVSREVSYAEHRIPGLGRPISQFVSGGAEVMQLSLLFDSYSVGLESHVILAATSGKMPEIGKFDVRFFTEPITKLMEVAEDIHAPPQVVFKWGTTKFEGYIISLTEKFTMFNSIGTPVRSVLDLTLRSSLMDSDVRNSPDRTKHRTVTEGDRLYLYADAEYGSCADWRHIANANGIDNPRLLQSGASIVIPPL